MAGYIGNKAVNLSTSGADISGTTNLDAVDIDGAVQIDATLSVGVNDTGYDVKFFGATASRHMTWDESADSLIISGDLDVNDGTIKLDGNYPTGTGNVALGDAALDDGSLSGDNNTAVGSLAMSANTTGTQNAAFGQAALDANTTGSNNTALGRLSVSANSTGGNNTGVGHSALASNTTASNNTAVGYQAGYSNTTGSSNVAVGVQSLYTNTTGASLSAVGVGALYANTTGSNNVAMGTSSLVSNTTGASNTGLGRDALRSNTTASNNTAVGYQAGYSNTTGGQNTLIGWKTGHSLTTGVSNTFVGCPGPGNNCGSLITTGSDNTIIGAFDGNQGGLDIRTSSNNIVLSDGDGNPRVYVNGDGDFILGGNAPVSSSQSNGSLIVRPTLTGSAQTLMQMLNNLNTTATGGKSYIDFYNGSGVEIGSITGNQSGLSYNTSSDHRLKENVVELTGATTRLKQLEPKRFNFIADTNDTVVDGFIAHEVQSIVPEAVTGTHNEVDDDGNPVYQGIDQSKLVPLLVATIKELEARITALENA